MDRTPVLIVTGPLGAGKTRLLTRLLAGEEARDTALLVNEFASLGVDQEIFSANGLEATAIAGGCICCALRGDVRRTLQDVLFARAEGQMPPFARVVIETSGAADPAPLVAEFLDDPVLRRRFPLAGIATVVDASVPLSDTRADPVALHQIALAETLIVSKLDLPGTDLAALAPHLASLNPLAPVLRADTVSLGDLLDPEAARRAQAAPAHAHGHVHGADLRTFQVETDAAADEGPLLEFVEDVVSQCGEALLRLKGVVPLSDGVAFLDVVRGTVFPARRGVLAQPGRPRAAVVVEGEIADQVPAIAAAHGLTCR